jgi:DNA repair protein RadC
MINMEDTTLLKVPIVRIKQVKQKTVEYHSNIYSAKEVISMINPIYRDLDREQFTVIGLNSQNQPNVINIVSVGSLNSAPVSPREVFKPLILSNCLSFICVHNHVSGAIQPSESDKTVTRILYELGRKLDIQLLDHIILGSGKAYFSFADEGILKTMKFECNRDVV